MVAAIIMPATVVPFSFFQNVLTGVTGIGMECVLQGVGCQCNCY